jgi:uridine kinase
MSEPEIVERIVSAALAAAPRAGSSRVIAIDGRAGSGKSTLARALAERLEAPIVDLELIYPGWDGLEAGVDLLAERVLAPLAEGHAAQVPRYDWRAGVFGDPMLLEPPPLVIVEGVGAGARAVSRFTSLLVWVELADDERRRRAIARDGDMFAPHWERWAAQEDAHYAREQTASRAGISV